MAKPNFVCGTLVGTGAALNVSLGFKPDYVKVFNPNDAGALFSTMEWFTGMPAASALKTEKTIDNGVTGNASSAYVTVNGISQYAGQAQPGGAAAGFTLGADAQLNQNGVTVCYIAMRGE